MKQLSRQDLRKLIESKTKKVDESAYNVPTRRDAAMAQAMANIEKQYGPGAIAKPKGFDDIMLKQMKRSKNPEVIQDIALAYDLMLKHAPKIVADPGTPEAGIGPDHMRNAVGEIQAKTGLDKRFLSFHIRKAVQQERLGKLIGLPTGSDLVKKIMSDRDAAAAERAVNLEKTTEMVGDTRITIKPAADRGKGRPTYGHTSIGTRFAPEGMPDEEAIKYLRSQYAGAPMWKFEISRDPASGKIYAYYEIDTSG